MEKKMTGVLLVNLGTPNSPDPKDVHRYLIEFLTDGRVIDSPWLIRQLLVRGLIVPKRYRQSAHSYKEIWTTEGSPLKFYGYRVKELLQKQLGEHFFVELAMRYQHPSIPDALRSLFEKPIEKLLILPLFPQYSSATTGSVHQKVMEQISSSHSIPHTTFISHYFEHPKLIRAFTALVQPYKLNNYDHILFSFHGLPQRQLHKADRFQKCLKEGCCHTLNMQNRNCYSAQCYATARAIAKSLNLSSESYSISFQSRLGKDPWMQPYTSDTLHKLASQGKKKLLVFSPSFVCDCLETIYEIGVEYTAEFKKAGGEQLDLVPGLNDHAAWIDTLAALVHENIGTE